LLTAKHDNRYDEANDAELGAVALACIRLALLLGVRRWLAKNLGFTSRRAALACEGFGGSFS
jgi:hypothetical protein